MAEFDRTSIDMYNNQLINREELQFELQDSGVTAAVLIYQLKGTLNDN